MSMVRPAGARLPDAFVRLIPVPADVLAESAQRPLCFPIERASLPHEVGHGIDHLAVDIELPLVGRKVAGPYRTRSSVAGQPIHDAFTGRLVAVHVVEHPELGLSQ